MFKIDKQRRNTESTQLCMYADRFALLILRAIHSILKQAASSSRVYRSTFLLNDWSLFMDNKLDLNFWRGYWNNALAPSLLSYGALRHDYFFCGSHLAPQHYPASLHLRNCANLTYGAQAGPQRRYLLLLIMVSRRVCRYCLRELNVYKHACKSKSLPPHQELRGTVELACWLA